MSTMMTGCVKDSDADRPLSAANIHICLTARDVGVDVDCADVGDLLNDGETSPDDVSSDVIVGTPMLITFVGRTTNSLHH